MNPICIDDYRKLAYRTLPHSVFDLVDGGAEDEQTLRRNRSGYQSLLLKPRVLRDVSTRDQSVVVCGMKLATPVLLAPTAAGQGCWPNGDILAARAARKMGTIFTASSYSGPSMEEIAKEGNQGLWFQLYIWKDRELVRSLVERAQSAGYQALVVTVDVPVIGAREKDIRNSLVMPPRITFKNALESLRHPGWVWRWLFSPKYILGNFVNAPGVEGKDLYSMRNLTKKNIDQTVSWKDIAWIRSLWKGPLIIKGILAEADALSAIEVGADAIVVSNHGGRQLDGAISGIEALVPIVKAVNGKIDVLVDGGICRGNEVVKAIALGAKAVMIGKSYLYGLSANGENGVHGVLEIFKNEIDRTMALVGVTQLSELDRSYIEFV